MRRSSAATTGSSAAVESAGYRRSAPGRAGWRILVSNNFTSEELLPFLRLLSGFDFATFCTADEVAGTPEKRDWYAHSMKAQVIDMETAAVADVVRAAKFRSSPCA